jgi:hypothetical protein
MYERIASMSMCDSRYFASGIIATSSVDCTRTWSGTNPPSMNFGFHSGPTPVTKPSGRA